MGIAAPLIGAAGALAGDIGSALFGSNQAQKQMDFQKEMASTAYQRTTADMRKAGLNPALMYGSAGPVGVSGGSMAPTPDFSNVSSSAVGMMQAKANVQKTLEEAHGQNIQNFKDSMGAFVDGSGRPLEGGYMQGEGKNRSFITFPKGGYFAPWGAVMMQNGAALSQSAKELNSANTNLSRAALPGAKISGSAVGGGVDVAS